MRLKKILAWCGLGVVVIGIGIQFVPVERTNPPVTKTINAPPDVMAILRRACFDCHSNETVWPWYAYVAPVSWLVASDVEEGREELNFSQWDAYNADRQAHKIKECGEEVAEGEMPLWFYVPAHPEARLSQADIRSGAIRRCKMPISPGPQASMAATWITPISCRSFGLGAIAAVPWIETLLAGPQR